MSFDCMWYFDVILMLEVLVNAALANLNSVFQHGKKITFFMYFSCQMYLSLVSKLRFIYGHKLLS